MIVYLGLDGVICNFPAGAMRLAGVSPATYPFDERPLWQGLGFRTQKDFNDRILSEPNFWENLESYEWTPGIIATMRHLENTRRGQFEWRVVPGLGLPEGDETRGPPDLDAQRSNWMKKHIDKNFSACLWGIKKHKLARVDAILVDGSGNACHAFEKAGGRAIQFPNRINGLRVADELTYFRAELRSKLMRDEGEPGPGEPQDFETERAVT